MGYYRPSRHGPLPAPTPAMTVIEISEEEQAKRKAEFEAMTKALYGEAGPPQLGKSKRRTW